ncbi:chloride channel protein, partial [Candidatus Saccharibacteria bacterium]|nr:chloride channel protein [Calditrichia bacterium]NIV72591.1 chloride channel protein [Calditrichia bacterium]NIV99709.1 chloride channel protein [Candidatus Saccharibacteria bacterium]NIW80011.1 chloride channel protein [Calditrichia bacterium]
VPAIGGIVTGAIVFFFAREAKGHGVPEVMEAIALKSGLIRPRVAITKLLASSLFIGTGGSVGREGPVIQIGASVGSTLGQIFRINPQRLKVLVACGAAAGIAAAFNAPVAGALFSLEIILGDFGLAQFSPIVVSSVVATAVSRNFLGDYPAFVVPKYELLSPYELLFYAALGLIAGLVSLLYIKVLYFFEDFFDNLRIHEILKTFIGGLAIGVMGLFVPQIFGVGYHTIVDALYGNMLWTTMFLMIFLKILATSISLGSGGSGGVFAPALFIGTMTGGFFGALIHQYFPFTAGPGAYSL